VKLERFRTFALTVLCIATLFGECALCSSQNANGNSTLASGFANPPQSARPPVRFWIPGAAVILLELGHHFQRTTRSLYRNQQLALPKVS
jgi:hypothetical protein